MPNVITDPAGTNYFDDSAQMLYVIIKGEDIITIKLSQLIKVAFGLPAMTIDQFYGSEVVNNLANYLGVSINILFYSNIICLLESFGNEKTSYSSTRQKMIKD